MRATLGCQCPDEVFRSVSIDKLRTADGAIGYTRLLVGNRLLIYILDAASVSVADGELADLVARGCRERNERGYNRFRLVIACDEPASESTAVQHAFDDASGSDERAHLHCLPRALLPAEVAPVG
ncbi:MAG TPA: hypothetical protein VLH36_10105 [Steroidobacteraceae bacterium]|nr:hypothetical protein [Steroidobacteraceae bacterium]